MDTYTEGIILIKRMTEWAQADLDKGKLVSSEVLFWIIGIGVLITLVLLNLSLIHPAFSVIPCDPLPSFECISKSTGNFKVLTLPLTGTVTIAAFWALIFRSHQTTEQIKTSQEQTQLTINNNTFNNYLAHKKEFVELLMNFEEDEKCTIKNKRHLYKILFPYNKPTNIHFKCDKANLMNLLSIDNKSIKEVYEKVYNSQGNDIQILAFERRIKELENNFKLTMQTVPTQIKNVKKIANLPPKLSDSLEIIRKMLKLIANFSEENTATNTMLSLSNILDDDNYDMFDTCILDFQSELTYPD